MASVTAEKCLVLITGANTGLGFETAKALFSYPESYHILIGCRGDIGRANDAIAKLKQLSPESKSTAEPLAIDISDDASIAAAYETVKEKFGYIDVLINNAGAAFDWAVRAGKVSKREAWNATWEVNVTGTHIMTEAFAPLLLGSRTGSPRLVFVTSGASSIGEYADGTSPNFKPPTEQGWPKQDSFMSGLLPYRSSKAALNLVAVDWAYTLQPDGVRVFNLSPGFLNTGLGDNRDTGEASDKSRMGALDPAVGGTFVADVVAGRRDEQAWPPRALRKSAVQLF